MCSWTPRGLSRTYAIWNSVRSTSEIRVAFMPLPTHEIGNWRSSRRRGRIAALGKEEAL